LATIYPTAVQLTQRCSCRARKELPPNFNKIPLNKLLKDKLSAIGVIYNDQTGLADYEDE